MYNLIECISSLTVMDGKRVCWIPNPNYCIKETQVSFLLHLLAFSLVYNFLRFPSYSYVLLFVCCAFMAFDPTFKSVLLDEKNGEHCVIFSSHDVKVPSINVSFAGAEWVKEGSSHDPPFPIGFPQFQVLDDILQVQKVIEELSKSLYW